MRRDIEFDAEGARLREAFKISSGAARDWFVEHLITGPAKPARVG